MKSIKITIIGLALALAFSLPLSARQSDDPGISFGVNFMFGARYDDMRMCVASPAGVKGGPVGDVQLYTKVHFNEKYALGFKLPIMRPILFSTAFNMLQFEPEFTFEIQHTINEDVTFKTGFGLGASMHYGPDYKAGKEDQNAESFPAAGPYISTIFGIGFKNDNNLQRATGIRLFYAPLFSEARGTGTVLGAALEYQMDFAKK